LLFASDRYSARPRASIQVSKRIDCGLWILRRIFSGKLASHFAENFDLKEQFVMLGSDFDE